MLAWLRRPQAFAEAARHWHAQARIDWRLLPHHAEDIRALAAWARPR